MPEPTPNADEPALYVLGMMNDRERREFEHRLAHSRELRASVRALESGALALTMASPRRDPPPDVWNGIQKAVAQEARQKVVPLFLRSSRLRAFLAAAACAVLGWYLHTLFNDRFATQLARPAVATPEAPAAQERLSRPLPPETVKAWVPTESSSQASNPAFTPFGASALAENAALRRQIWELEKQVSHLTQVLTQQQVLPPDLNRLSFFNLSPPPAVGVGEKATLPSPELQRALLMALARELGWLPPPANATPEAKEQKLEDPTPSLRSGDVEFVDLRPAGSEGARRPLYVPEEKATTDLPTAENNSGSTSIPAFTGGANLTFAVNSAAALGHDAITVWSAAGTGQSVSLGNVAVGAGPTVVTVPFGMVPGGTHVTITAGSVVIGQFSSPSSASP